MKNYKRQFYLNDDANQALEELYADQRAMGNTNSYSDIVSRALEVYSEVGWKKTSCESDKCGFYYAYQCHCPAGDETSRTQKEQVTCFDGKDYEKSTEWQMGLDTYNHLDMMGYIFKHQNN